MEIRPIFSAMLRNKTGAILIALQIALTLAIVCNAVFIIHDRLAQMARDPGMDVDDMIVIVHECLQAGLQRRQRNQDRPGRVAQHAGCGGRHLQPVRAPERRWLERWRHRSCGSECEVVHAPWASIHMDEHGLNTLGVKLIEGRNFTHEEIAYIDQDKYTTPKLAIVSKAFGEKLWPGQDALGKTFYEGNDGVNVIGVVDTLEGTWPHWPGFERNIIFPTVLEGNLSRMLVRTLPGQRDAVMKQSRTNSTTPIPATSCCTLRSLT